MIPALEATAPGAYSARYFALLYSPMPQHAALKALFAIEREIFESLKPGLDHHVAHSRLQWWREECERAVAGQPVHPLTRALADALANARAHAPPDARADTWAHVPPDTRAHAPADTRAHAPPDAQAHASSDARAHASSDARAHAPPDTWAHVPPDARAHAPPDTRAHAPAAESPQSADGSRPHAPTGNPELQTTLAHSRPQTRSDNSRLQAPGGSQPQMAGHDSRPPARHDSSRPQTVGDLSVPQSHSHALPSAARAGTSGLAGRPRLEGLSGLVDVAVWDLASATFETRRELTAYCQRWGGAMLETIGGESTWRSIGASLREIELLSDVAREAHYGRIRLPLDELERVKVEPTLLAKTPLPAAVAEMLRGRHRALRDEITRGLVSIACDRQGALRGLIVWAALACRMSRRAERALPNRLQAGRFDAISDAWAGWQIARRATAGRFRPI